MHPVTIGPFLFSMGILALLAGVIAAQLASGYIARRGGVDVGNGVYMLLGLVLLAGRAGFVARGWDAYAAQPLDILNVRDGGFDLLSGLAMLVLATSVMLWRRPSWRRALPAALVVGLAAWALLLFGGARLDAAGHPSLPSITVRTLGGTSVKATSWRGQPTVINFWATWCAPCRREMPVLAEAQRELAGVRFVFVDQGESPGHVRAYLAALSRQPENVLVDDGALARHYNVRGYPTTLFVDRQGRLREIRVGELSRASLRVSLRRILASPGKASGEQGLSRPPGAR